MKWTPLRSAIRARFADSLVHRVDIHQARYRRTLEETGRIWITVDRREIISFDTGRYVARREEIAHQMRSGEGPFGLSANSTHAEYLAADAAAAAHLRRAGLYDDYSALKDLEESLSMSLERMLASESPLVRALAVIDRRFGKRRLRQFDPECAEHALVRELLTVRRSAEGVAVTHARGGG